MWVSFGFVDKWGSSQATWLSRGRRHAVELEAVVIKDGAEEPCRVTDLSLDGCCLSGDFIIGEHVTVRIRPIGIFPAQIRWAFSGRAGARFIRSAPAPAQKSLVGDDRGTATIEYSLIATLIAVALVAAVGRTGTAVGNNWNQVETALPGGTAYTPGP